jgi:hypothetical protein
MCGILALTALAYLYSAFTGFLGDDFPLIETASRTNPFSAFLARVDVYYRPLVWSTFALDYSLWGISPVGYHSTNILIHLANTTLAMLIAGEVAKKAWTPLAVGLYFGLTPTHTGSVVWLFARTDLLCATFYFATVLLLLKHAKHRSARLAVGLVSTTLLALLCKEMALSLPLVAFVVSFSYSDERRVARVLDAVRGAFPVLVALGIYLTGRYVYVDGLPISPMHDHWTVVKLAVNLARYLATLIVPFNLEAVKPFFRAHLWALLLASVLFLLLAMSGTLQLRRNKASLPVILCTLLAISPVIRLFAPWYLYIPSLGIAILLGIVIELVPSEAFGRSWVRGLIVLIAGAHLVGLWQKQTAIRTSSDWVSVCIESLADEGSNGEIAIVTAVPTESVGIPAFGWIYNLQVGLGALDHRVQSIPLTGVRLSGENIDVATQVGADGTLDIQVPPHQGFFRLPSLAAQQGSIHPQVGGRLETEDATLIVKAVNDGGFPTALRIEPRSFSVSDPNVRLFTLNNGGLTEVSLPRE